jgi:hypothetical protein
MMGNYTNDAVKSRMIQLFAWRINVKTTYKAFINTLKDIRFWFTVAQNRQMVLTEAEANKLNWANTFLNDAVKARDFFDKRQALLKRQPVEVV